MAVPVLAGTVVDQGMANTGNKAWRFQGAAASGSSIVQAGNPLPVCGSDGTNCITFALDALGNTKVVGPDVIGTMLPTGAPVQVAGYSSISGVIPVALDGVGHTIVAGPDAPGTGASVYPVQVAGTDPYGDIHPLLVNTYGAGVMAGPDDPVSTPTMNPLQMSGVDGTGAIRRLLTNTLGSMTVVGVNAVGVAPTVNPVLIAGVDGSGNVVLPKYTSSGSSTVAGPEAAGVTATANPFVAAGVDGTGVIQRELTDTGGRQVVVGAAASGQAVIGAPVLIGGIVQVDGPQTTRTAGTASRFTQDQQGRQYVRSYAPDYWNCIKTGITATTECKAAPGANLYLNITDVILSNETNTSLEIGVVSGTGTNCATGRVTAVVILTMSRADKSALLHHTFTTPVKLPVNSAACCYTNGTTAFACQLAGFTSP